MIRGLFTKPEPRPSTGPDAPIPTRAEYGLAHPFTGAFIICAYSRAQAIADGELIDCSDLALEAGIKVPTAISCRAFDTCVAIPDPLPRSMIGQSISGRMWNVVWLAAAAARSCARTRKPNDQPTDQVRYTVRVLDETGVHRVHRLWAKAGPGDDGEMCLTVMAEGED
jgi:hypothetical protein